MLSEGKTQGELAPVEIPKSAICLPLAVRRGFQRSVVSGGLGGNGREPWQVAAFQEVVSDCHLADLGYHGIPYT